MRNLLVSLWVMLTVPALTLAAEDAPGRVARLSHIEGDVSMAAAGTQEWGEAVVNRPLTSEDRLFVDQKSRAELQVGSAMIHLDASTEFSFIDLDDDAMTMNLTEGRLTIRVVRKRDNETIEVNTPNASVSLLHPGEYTIEVNDEGDQTIVKARSGSAEVAGEKKTYEVRADEVGVFRGTDELTADINRLGPRTAFESWAHERSLRNERSASSRYVSEEVIGYEDLDEHGHWAHEPAYGYVWYPSYVTVGWAPYRYGRWAWVSPWGWTWVDHAHWGFAPFHYGRWAYVNTRWCWVPGPRHVRPVYAPALVAWTAGPSFGVSVSFGNVGWFPLAPHEVYVPGYWHSHRYIHSVNVSNTIIVNNTYINNAYRGRFGDYDYRYRHRGDAVTIVDRDRFIRGRLLDGQHARVNDRDLRGFRQEARPPAIVPVRDSLRAAQPTTVRLPEHDRGDRQIVARRAVPTRVGFDQERQAIEANGGRPITRSHLIDRGATERRDVRIARGEIQGVQGRRLEAAGAAPRLESAHPQERLGRSPRDASDNTAQRGLAPSGSSVQRLEPRERAELRTNGSSRQRVEVIRGGENDDRALRETSSGNALTGSAPSTGSNERPQRNSSDWGARQRLEQQPRIESRQLEQRDTAREAPRSQNEAWQSSGRMQRFEQPREAQPRVEQPRSQPSYSPAPQREQRLERAAPESRPMSQPRSDSSNSGRSSQHSRGFERGNPRER